MHGRELPRLRMELPPHVVLMTHYHAVLVDETGCEFGAGTEAANREEAREYFREEYPESRVVQIESPQDTQEREAKMHQHIARGGDWDDEDRPYDYD